MLSLPSIARDTVRDLNQPMEAISTIWRTGTGQENWQSDL
jgi:hypothetical protein